MRSYLVYQTLNILFNVVAGSLHSLTIVLYYPTFIVTAQISLKSGKCEHNGSDSLAIQATLMSSVKPDNSDPLCLYPRSHLAAT
jgi:hypothetical protein